MDQIFAEKFKAARVLRGLSLEELSEKINRKVTKQALHKYEKGIVVPDKVMIELLADALEVRTDFFFSETQVELGPIEFRKLMRLPAKEEYKLVEQVRDALSRYLKLEQTLSVKMVFKNPLEGTQINNYQDLNNAAENLREEWQLGTDPIYNCIELLEDNHIKVIEVESDESFDGMQTWVNETIPVIAINVSKVKSNDRKRFTALHELAHLLLPIEDINPKTKEKFCHQFAAALLLPEDAAKTELGTARSKLSIQELGTLKQKYGISIQAIVARAKDLSIISESYYKQFFFYINHMGWRTQEPYRYEGIEKSNRFDLLLHRALAEEILSIEEAALLKNQTVDYFKNNFLKRLD